MYLDSHRDEPSSSDDSDAKSAYDDEAEYDPVNDSSGRVQAPTRVGHHDRSCPASG
jgi:hypothetical protein